MKDKAYEIAINPKNDRYQRRLASMVYTCVNKKTGLTESINEEQAKELHKPVIKKFKRKVVYARFKNNIWGADLAEMGSSSSKYRGVKYLLCAKDVLIKYTWVKPLKDKKAKTVLHGFVGIVNKCKREPRKKIYNSPMQKYLDSNDILMYSTHNEGKSVAA